LLSRPQTPIRISVLKKTPIKISGQPWLKRILQQWSDHIAIAYRSIVAVALSVFFHFSWQQNRNRELKMLRSLAASVMSAKKHHEIKLRAKPEKTGKQCKYF